MTGKMTSQIIDMLQVAFPAEAWKLQAVINKEKGSTVGEGFMFMLKKVMTNVDDEIIEEAVVNLIGYKKTLPSIAEIKEEAKRVSHDRDLKRRGSLKDSMLLSEKQNEKEIPQAFMDIMNNLKIKNI